MARVPHDANLWALRDPVLWTFGPLDAPDVAQQATVWITPDDPPALPKVPIFYDKSRVENFFQYLADPRYRQPTERPLPDHTPEDLVQAFTGVLDLDALLYGDATPVESTSCLAEIAYDKHDRANDPGIATCQTYVGIEFHQSASAVLDFGDAVRGGELRAMCYDGLIDFPLEFFRIHMKVRGLNPPKQMIRDYIDRVAQTDEEALMAKVLACKESQFHQFWSEGFPAPKKTKDELGEPVFGVPNGFGIMQIDNAPAATPEQLWNWQKNVDGGLEHLRGARAQALADLGALEAANPGAPDLPTEIYGLKKFSLKDIHIEIYQRYNGGAYFLAYDEDSVSWLASPDAKANGSICWTIEQCVQHNRFDLPPYRRIKHWWFDD